jgi:hypothetical protein
MAWNVVDEGVEVSWEGRLGAKAECLQVCPTDQGTIAIIQASQEEEAARCTFPFW